jgi:hypothetical protein
VDLTIRLEDVIPDLGMRGHDDPHGRSALRGPLTVGQLATRIHDLAARPADWWHLVRFDPAGPVRVPLEDTDGVRLWLTTWPPRSGTGPHDHDGETSVSAVVAGELVEVTVSSDGATERELRANRVRVRGGGHLHELHNPGPAYAITLHAHLTH